MCTAGHTEQRGAGLFVLLRRYVRPTLWRGGANEEEAELVTVGIVSSGVAGATNFDERRAPRTYALTVANSDGVAAVEVVEVAVGECGEGRMLSAPLLRSVSFDRQGSERSLLSAPVSFKRLTATLGSHLWTSRTWSPSA